MEGGVLYVTFDNVGVSQAGVCGLTRTDTRPPSYSEGHFVLKKRYLNSQCVEVLECSRSSGHEVLDNVSDTVVYGCIWYSLFLFADIGVLFLFR